MIELHNFKNRTVNMIFTLKTAWKVSCVMDARSVATKHIGILILANSYITAITVLSVARCYALFCCVIMQILFMAQLMLQSVLSQSVLVSINQS